MVGRGRLTYRGAVPAAIPVSFRLVAVWAVITTEGREGRPSLGWLRDLFRDRPREWARRFTPRRLFGVAVEEAALADHQTVQRWARELRPDRDQAIVVFRSWGAVFAEALGHRPVQVVLSHGGKSWVAAVPGSDDDRDLTPDQVEHVLLDALTSSGPPSWPVWRHLV